MSTSRRPTYPEHLACTRSRSMGPPRRIGPRAIEVEARVQRTAHPVDQVQRRVGATGLDLAQVGPRDPESVSQLLLRGVQVDPGPSTPVRDGDAQGWHARIRPAEARLARITPCIAAYPVGGRCQSTRIRRSRGMLGNSVRGSHGTEAGRACSSQPRPLGATSGAGLGAQPQPARLDSVTLRCHHRCPFGCRTTHRRRPRGPE